MATLGYGDAIGHEALGIQQVLRRAGYESRIYVQTADPRLEDLTTDYRDLLDDSRPQNILIHHFSLGSRASRVAFALPDRMVLVYHNITPPSASIQPWSNSAIAGDVSSKPTSRAAISHWAILRLTGGS